MKIVTTRLATICLFVCCLLFHGCSTLSSQYQKDEYERTMFDFDTAMQVSDFNSICKYTDPTVLKWEACMKYYNNLKIIEYEVLDIEITEEDKKVTQNVVVDYHFRDRVVLKKIHYEQIWQYQEERKAWLLQSKPPIFE